MTRTAVVTGGAQGIGAAVARRLAARTDRVWILDLASKSPEGTGVAQSIGGGFMAVDVTDPASLDAGFEACGTVDVLVNCAGVTIPGQAVDAISPQDWNLQIAVNLTGTWLAMRAVVGSMRERGWGRIVNLASGLATRGMAGSAAYAASKAGVTGLTRAAAADLAPYGVTVNAVSPGYVDTPMTRGFTEELRKKRLEEITMGRFADPDEIASVVQFLASDDAGYVTGEVVDVTGGFRIC